MSTARQLQAATRSSVYAVVWRHGESCVASGRLTLERSLLVLCGRGADGAPRRERVPLEQVAAVRIGRTEPERVRGERSVVLELRDGTTLAVAPIGAVGEVFELADLLASVE